MATIKQKVEAEARMRDLLKEARLPPPDAVEYGYTCIRLFWRETKTVIVIDLDEPPGGWEMGPEDGLTEGEAPPEDRREYDPILNPEPLSDN